MTTIRQLIQNGPAKANELFAKLGDTSDTAVKTRERLFAELKEELELLARLEEEHIFPVLRKNKKTKGLVPDALNDNKLTRKLLAQLEEMPKDSEEFTDGLAELRRTFQQHVRDEKKELLPAVLKALSDEEAQAIVEGIEDTKAEVEEARRAEAEQRRAAAREEREQAENVRQTAESVAETMATTVCLSGSPRPANCRDRPGERQVEPQHGCSRLPKPDGAVREPHGLGRGRGAGPTLFRESPGRFRLQLRPGSRHSRSLASVACSRPGAFGRECRGLQPACALPVSSGLHRHAKRARS
jgi:hypothetical protein